MGEQRQAVPAGHRLAHGSGLALVGLGILHLLVLGADALPHLRGWLRLELWTDAHWQPFAAQAHALLASNAAFWASVGSFAAPLIVLGLLVAWMARRRQAVPAFVGLTLLGWTLSCALVIELSGFPLGVIIAACLMVGIRRQHRSMALEALS